MFYKKVLRELLKKEEITKKDSVLVLCGGMNDRNAFHELGFENVVISNLGYHWGQKDYSPYAWKAIDAENVNP